MRGGLAEVWFTRCRAARPYQRGAPAVTSERMEIQGSLEFRPGGGDVFQAPPFSGVVDSFTLCLHPDRIGAIPSRRIQGGR